MDHRTNRVYSIFNRATGFLRPLPNFLVIGAQKSGTTSFFHYLSQHPRIINNKSKEIHFFDNNYVRGPMWYRCQFPLLASLQLASIVGEVTPYYLCHPHAPQRIHELIPEVKLIVLLRNPVDRAISHYFHEVKKNREMLSIGDAMVEEDTRCNLEWVKMQENPLYVSRAHQSFSYKQRGIYIKQLQYYLKYFDRDQLHIVDSNQLFRSPHEVLRKAFSFLGVDSNFKIKDVSIKNANPLNTGVPVDVVESLTKFFTPYNEQLKDDLGVDFGW